MNEITLNPIGAVRCEIADSSRDEYWGGIESAIELDAAVLGADATAGLEAFSHLVVVYHFHEVAPEQVERGARHPKGRKNWPLVGILAQRAKRRPNRIGVCTCRLVRVEGLRLRVLDLDAIDGTPVLDVKPYMVEFGARGEVREPEWSKELMATYFAKAIRE